MRERFDLLEDALEITTHLFTGDVVSYDGRVVSLEDAQLLPAPVQQPHPPIWIGGSGPRQTLPLVARYADVSHTWGTPTRYRDEPAARRLATQAGRDQASILRASSPSLDDLDTAREHATKWRDAGYDYLVWFGSGAEDAADAGELATDDCLRAVGDHLGLPVPREVWVAARAAATVVDPAVVALAARCRGPEGGGLADQQRQLAP